MAKIYHSAPDGRSQLIKSEDFVTKKLPIVPVAANKTKRRNWDMKYGIKAFEITTSYRLLMILLYDKYPDITRNTGI